MRLLLRLTMVAIMAMLAVLWWSWREGRADPIVRRAAIGLPDWPARAAPVRVALISDIHIGTRVMDGARLDRIVTQVNGLRPDLVLIAGDFIGGHKPGSATALGRPLEALQRVRAPLGVGAVLGNHDHWTGAEAVASRLRNAGVTVLANHAVIRGPLAIGGVDDEPTGHADVGATLAALRRLPGARVVLSHSPDIAPQLSPDASLLLAGYTHCGQIVLPLYGPIASVTRFGERYRCGVRRERGRTTIVSAGLGTSVIPLRLRAPPDLWLLTLGPVDQSSRGVSRLKTASISSTSGTLTTTIRGISRSRP